MCQGNDLRAYVFDAAAAPLNSRHPMMSRTIIAPRACHVFRIGADDQNVGTIQFHSNEAIHPSRIKTPMARMIIATHPIGFHSLL